MKYVIPYEQLIDELATSEDAKRCFNKVKECANKNRLELSDEDFKRLYKLRTENEDIDWIMLRMSRYELSLVDALVCYITY